VARRAYLRVFLGARRPATFDVIMLWWRTGFNTRNTLVTSNIRTGMTRMNIGFARSWAGVVRICMVFTLSIAASRCGAQRRGASPRPATDSLPRRWRLVLPLRRGSQAVSANGDLRVNPSAGPVWNFDGYCRSSVALLPHGAFRSKLLSYRSRRPS